MFFDFTEHKHNFQKKSNEETETFGLPYDFDSLMHYPNDAFAKPGTNLTIVSKVYFTFYNCEFLFLNS